MRVLVVDDHPGLAQLLATSLEAEGFEARSVSDRFAHLLTPDAWVGIDAAILDLYLSGRDLGTRIARYLAGEHPEIRVVLLTGADDVSDELAGLAAAVLRKPAELDNILTALGADSGT